MIYEDYVRNNNNIPEKFKEQFIKIIALICKKFSGYKLNFENFRDLKVVEQRIDNGNVCEYNKKENVLIIDFISLERENFNLEHALIHEFFHILSSTREITGIETGGTTALNEGITELLATIVDLNNDKHMGYLDETTFIMTIVYMSSLESVLTCYFENDTVAFFQNLVLILGDSALILNIIKAINYNFYSRKSSKISNFGDIESKLLETYLKNMGGILEEKIDGFKNLTKVLLEIKQYALVSDYKYQDIEKSIEILNNAIERKNR